MKLKLILKNAVRIEITIKTEWKWN